MLSQEFIFRFQPALHLEIGASGNADAPRTRHFLQQGGDLEAIARGLPLFLRHFPEMNPDPERDSASLRKPFVPRAQFFLGFHGALHGRRRAVENRKQSIPIRVHDAALVFLDKRTDRLAVDLEGLECRRLILPHEAAVPFGVGA